MVRLAPEPVPDATWIVDQGAGPGGLQLCAPLAPIAGKVRSPEHLWTTRAMARWMLSPPNTAQNLEVGSDLEPLPVREERTHVGIGTSGTARENHLFQTVGLRFPPSVGLGVRVEAPPVCGDLPEDFGLCPLGGERRGAWLRSVALGPVPDFSEAGKVLSRTRRLRIVLVTPAVWTGGWLPDGLGVQGSLVRGRLAGRGPEVRLVAACVGRWTAISGWDLQLRKPKPLRRAAPAGSVFFFELEQALSAEAATELLRSLWLGPGLCESARDVLDGFAVPVAGIW